MKIFNLLQGKNIEEQLDKLHGAVANYLKQVKKKTQSTEEGKEIDKTLHDLNEIKGEIISALASKKTSSFVLHALNVVYNFDSFFNPIGSAVVTYAIRTLYINMVALEVITNINNTIKCICMDIIARSKSERGVAEVSEMAKDYNMKVSDVVNVTQKFVDSRDAQVIQMLEQTVQRDLDSFNNAIKSANNLIDAFSKNDKWVAEWAITCKSITEQSAATVCLNIRKSMGAYIVAMATCLDKKAMANVKFNRDGTYYLDDNINSELQRISSQYDKTDKKIEKGTKEHEEIVKQGKTIFEEKNIKSAEAYFKLDGKDRAAVTAYLKENPSKADDSIKLLFDNDRLLSKLKNILPAYSKYKDDKDKEFIKLKTDFIDAMGDDNTRRCIEEHAESDFSTYTIELLKKAYKNINNDNKGCEIEANKREAQEIMAYEKKLESLKKILDDDKSHGRISSSK